MKLWILERLVDVCVMDITQVIVVRASSASAARKIAHEEHPKENGSHQVNEHVGLWLDPKKTSCDPLVYSGKAGVIIEDFYGV